MRNNSNNYRRIITCDLVYEHFFMHRHCTFSLLVVTECWAPQQEKTSVVNVMETVPVVILSKTLFPWITCKLVRHNMYFYKWTLETGAISFYNIKVSFLINNWSIFHIIKLPTCYKKMKLSLIYFSSYFIFLFTLYFSNFTGYNDILLIPAGATNIKVEEVSPTNNYLGINLT